MKTWIKICGLTEERAVDAALAAGADALGFVFVRSPRQISTDEALALKARVAGRAAVVAVMRHPDRELVDRIVREFGPDILQADRVDANTLALPDGCEYLPVVHEGRAADLRHPPARILYEGEQSGVGQLANWDRARALAGRTRVILAGGLNPDNVGEAIRRVRPYGVDVSSGVESGPGDKDPQRIRDFVAAVRDVETELNDDEDILREY